jgi:peptide chain release factor 3
MGRCAPMSSCCAKPARPSTSPPSWPGTQTPVFFGSGINNFGVREILQALVEWAPPPQPRDGGARMVQPAEAPFTGFVFKIQANMDPKHRDRIAFFRVCSGRYTPGMKVSTRTGKRDETRQRADLHGQRARAMEDAVAGDIIGIHNHGQLQIGDTLTEGEALGFKGIPYFAPEMFRTARRATRSSRSSCRRACRNSARKAPSRSSKPSSAATCCSAPSASCSSRSSPSASDRIQGRRRSTSRRTSTPRAGSPSPTTPASAEFEKDQAMRLAHDVDGNPVYLAWPEV